MKPTSYRDRQSQRDREYAEAFKGLSKRDRKRLEAMGITGAELPSYKILENRATEAFSGDVAIYAPNDDENEPQAYPDASNEVLSFDIVRQVVGIIVGQSKPRLTIDCLALLTGISYDGETETAIAKRHKLSRAAVSKRCIQMTKHLNLQPSRVMRSLTARESYARAQLSRIE
jgi:hypothetical protein